MSEVATVAIKRTFVIGDRLMVIADITASNDYPADLNGYALPASKFGLTEIHDVSPSLSTVTAHTAGYDYTNKTLRVYAAGVEVADAVNISTAVFRVKAIGRGFPNSSN